MSVIPLPPGYLYVRYAPDLGGHVVIAGYPNVGKLEIWDGAGEFVRNAAEDEL